MRTTLHIDVPEGTDPFSVHSTDSKRTRFRKLANIIKAMVAGGLVQSRASGAAHAKAVTGLLPASAVVTCATVVAGNTLTLNGTALTATQHNATGTVTTVAANTDEADTVTLQGVVFTAAAAEDTATGAFTFAADNASATSLGACITAAANGTGVDGVANPLYGLVTVVVAANVVTIRAVTGGTGGNAITLESSDADGLAVSGSGTLTNGATVAANQFDYVGTNTQTATALAAAVAASTTDLISGNLVASNISGTIALSSVAAGAYVDIGPVRFKAVSLTGNGINEFAIGGTDTEDATSLVTAINAHPFFKDKLRATSSSGTVTVRSLPDINNVAPTFLITSPSSGITETTMAPGATVLVMAKEKGFSGNQATIASSGATLAITGGVSRLAGGTRTTFAF